MLSLATLTEIIKDTAPGSQTLQQVGLVGSYADNSANTKSDVDLVFDTGDNLIDEAALSVGLAIKKILADQFSIDTDIIDYNTILKRVDDPNGLHVLEVNGYKKMLHDLKWLWRRD
jgi:predicted nucleotidyltransferase